MSDDDEPLSFRIVQRANGPTALPPPSNILIGFPETAPPGIDLAIVFSIPHDAGGAFDIAIPLAMNQARGLYAALSKLAQANKWPKSDVAGVQIESFGSRS